MFAKAATVLTPASQICQNAADKGSKSCLSSSANSSTSHFLVSGTSHFGEFLGMTILLRASSPTCGKPKSIPYDIRVSQSTTTWRGPTPRRSATRTLSTSLTWVRASILQTRGKIGGSCLGECAPLFASTNLQQHG